jgi:AcrR family transcriptional regulator
MQDVARRAGVGVGTVYRHFSSRQALIEAIAHPFFERGLRLASTVKREVPEEDRFAQYVRDFARVLAAHGVLGQCMWDAPAAEPVRAELRVLVGEFVDSARRHGMLRQDFTSEDAFALLWTIAALVEAAREPIWQRHVDVLLDSLRGRPPRNLLAPPIDRAQWDEFVRSAHTAVEA